MMIASPWSLLLYNTASSLGPHSFRRHRALAIAAVILVAMVPIHAQEKADREPLGYEFEEPDRSELYKKAKEAFGNLDFEAAEKFFRQIILESEAHSRQRFPARIRAAMALSNLKRYEEAEAEIRIGIKEEELSDVFGWGITIEAHKLLARILTRQGKLSAAEAVYRDDLKSFNAGSRDTSGRSEVVRRALIEFLRSQNKHAEVVAELRLLISAEESWILHQDLAEALINSGQLREGLKEARALQSVNVRDYRVTVQHFIKTRVLIARALTGLGQFSEAEGQLRMVLEDQTKSLGGTHPDTLRTLFEMAKCLRAQRKFDAALIKAKGLTALSHKTLGPEHADTKEYEKFLSELSGSGD